MVETFKFPTQTDKMYPNINVVPLAKYIPSLTSILPINKSFPFRPEYWITAGAKSTFKWHIRHWSNWNYS